MAELKSTIVKGNLRVTDDADIKNIKENGTNLSDKYLGKTAKASDADKLDGNDSSYYLNYNNLNNKPTIPTITVTDVQVGGTSILSNKVANLVTNSTYNASTNKIATMSDLPDTSDFIQKSDTSGLVKNDGTIDTTTYSTFSGSYNDLSNKPTIPTKVSQLTNDEGFITGITSSNVTTALGYTPLSAASNTVTDSDTNIQYIIGKRTGEVSGNNNYINTKVYFKGNKLYSGGNEVLTSHQSIKSFNTNNSTAQTASSSEAIAGSGTINLHKVSKTGSYSDLLNKPTIPATNVIPATTTANKVLVSTTTSGTAKWSNFSTAGLLKTNTSGVISVDTTQYKKGNFEPDFSDGLQITTGDQDFASDIYVPYATTSQYGVVKIGANPSSTSSTLTGLSLNGTSYAIPEVVTEISTQNVIVWNLNPGIYKLTYNNSEKRVCYYGTNTSYYKEITSANPIYLVVDQTSTNVKGWRVTLTDVEGTRITCGYSQSNTGKVTADNYYIAPRYVHHIIAKGSSYLIQFDIINTSSDLIDNFNDMINYNEGWYNATGYYKTSTGTSVSYLGFVRRVYLEHTWDEDYDYYTLYAYYQKYTDGSDGEANFSSVTTLTDTIDRV